MYMVIISTYNTVLLKHSYKIGCPL